MAEFLTANGISFYIENIIKEAGVELYLLMPDLKLSGEFYAALKDLSGRGTPSIIVYNNEDLHTEEKLMLGELANLEIYHSQNLNAKCCCSEENVLITSMDVNQFIADEALEMGILINKTIDSELYKKTYNEVKSIIDSSKNMNLHKRPVEELDRPQIKVRKVYHGFCIRCAMPISYNIANPLCRSCISKNINQPDEAAGRCYCHMCGSASSAGEDSAVCAACKSVNLTDV